MRPRVCASLRGRPEGDGAAPGRSLFAHQNVPKGLQLRRFAGPSVAWHSRTRRFRATEDLGVSESLIASTATAETCENPEGVRSHPQVVACELRLHYRASPTKRKGNLRKSASVGP